MRWISIYIYILYHIFIFRYQCSEDSRVQRVGSIPWMLHLPTWCCIWSNVYKPWKFQNFHARLTQIIPKVPSIHSSIHPFIHSSDCILMVSEVCTYLGYQVHLCSYWFGPFFGSFFFFGGGCCVGFLLQNLVLNKIYCIYMYMFTYKYLEIKIFLFFGLDPSGQTITNSLDWTSQNSFNSKDGHPLTSGKSGRSLNKLLIL